MAIIPPVIDDQFKSSRAEKAILDKFLSSKFSFNPNVCVFHSLRAQHAGKKLVGEIDFIYLV